MLYILVFFVVISLLSGQAFPNIFPKAKRSAKEDLQAKKSMLMKAKQTILFY
jgi:biopolymer transport protein ExbD